MTGRRATGWLLAAWLLGGCAGLLPPRAALVFPPAGDEEARARAVAERARAAEVVYLGEKHDNAHHHAHQRRILEAMLAGGARPALAFEMLHEGQQAAVEAALTPSATAAEVERRLGWQERRWPDFAMYWPLFALAARHGLDVVATDLDPTLSRRIAREGLAALGSGGAALGSLLQPDPRREDGIAGAIREGHCGLLPEERLPSMVQSWHARNVTMARRIAEALGRAGQVVVIVGSGHQEAGGLPDQLAALRPGTRQLTVEMAEVSSGERPEAVAAGSTADVVWLTPEVARPDPCEPLRRRPQPLE